MFEIFGEDSGLEEGKTVDDEAIAILGPGYYLRDIMTLRYGVLYLENAKSVSNKGRRLFLFVHEQLDLSSEFRILQYIITKLASFNLK